MLSSDTLLRYIFQSDKVCYTITYVIILKDVLITNWMIQDPVKYPDSMTPSFKSFLKGLLNKVVHCWTFPFHFYLVRFYFNHNDFIHFSFLICSKQAPESRLTWPALLEHPFVKETNNEIEDRVGILNFMPSNSALGKMFIGVVTQLSILS